MVMVDRAEMADRSDKTREASTVSSSRKDVGAGAVTSPVASLVSFARASTAASTVSAGGAIDVGGSIGSGGSAHEAATAGVGRAGRAAQPASSAQANTHRRAITDASSRLARTSRDRIADGDQQVGRDPGLRAVLRWSIVGRWAPAPRAREQVAVRTEGDGTTR